MVIILVPEKEETLFSRRNCAKDSYNFEVVPYLCRIHVQKSLRDKGRLNNTKAISGREDTRACKRK